MSAPDQQAAARAASEARQVEIAHIIFSAWCVVGPGPRDKDEPMDWINDAAIRIAALPLPAPEAAAPPSIRSLEYVPGRDDAEIERWRAGKQRAEAERAVVEAAMEWYMTPKDRAQRAAGGLFERCRALDRLRAAAPEGRQTT